MQMLHLDHKNSGFTLEQSGYDVGRGNLPWLVQIS